MLLTFSVCHNLSVHGVSLAKTDVCPTFRTKCWSLLCVSPAKHLMFTQKSMITVILGPKFPLCKNIHNQSFWNEYTMFWSSPQLTILHLLSETIKLGHYVFIEILLCLQMFSRKLGSKWALSLKNLKFYSEIYNLESTENTNLKSVPSTQIIHFCLIAISVPSVFRLYF